MKDGKSKEIIFEVVEEEERYSNTVRVQKKDRRRIKTTLEINKAVQGTSIELMLERIRNDEGIENIPDRDVVYNNDESETVNPITNIRTDKFEKMLEEKDGEYQHRNRKHMKVVKEDDKENKEKDSPTEGSETGTQD